LLYSNRQGADQPYVLADMLACRNLKNIGWLVEMVVGPRRRTGYSLIHNGEKA